MAEHHKVLQPPLLLHGFEGQEGPEGFAGTGSGKDQHVLVAVLIAFQTAPEQLD